MIIIMLALTVGVLFATGTYLILRRGQIKLILGLGLLSHGVNLLLFGSGRLTVGKPPIITDAQHAVEEGAALVGAANASLADPLPQALILTAIVISFGITAFVIALVHRRHELTSSDVLQGEIVAILRHVDPFYHAVDESNAEQAIQVRRRQAWLLVQELEEDADDIDLVEYLDQDTLITDADETDADEDEAIETDESVAHPEARENE
jgi:multicomponent Na+:H+ antiporter subunit C